VNTDWQDEAACRGMDPTVFVTITAFPKYTPISDIRDFHATALVVCARCPVEASCLAAGLREKGVWGGTVEQERDPRRARNKRAAEQRAALRRAS
jgi:WhiB family redox-sensing transcriptional regulator